MWNLYIYIIFICFLFLRIERKKREKRVHQAGWWTRMQVMQEGGSGAEGRRESVQGTGRGKRKRIGWIRVLAPVEDGWFC